MTTREIREMFAYVLGGIGFMHELLIAQAERPFLLTASLALMGFPFVFKADELLSKKKKDTEDIQETKKE